MFWLKKILFKGMELGLGIRPYFSLVTKDPVFINFKLSDEEAGRVQEKLTPGFRLQMIRFSERDAAPSFWVSYNLYELKYPRKELAKIRKVRCEINTFVEAPDGRKGIYVFSGSPYVSKEGHFSLIGKICDWAEALVIWIYGCGRLLPLRYFIDKKRLEVDLSVEEACVKMLFRQEFEEKHLNSRVDLSEDYIRFNDISFFGEGMTYDLVNANSVFSLARFSSVPKEDVAKTVFESPFFTRSPDHIYFYLGEIPYLVSAMNAARFK